MLALCLLASGYGLVLIYTATRWNDNSRSVPVQCLGIFLGVVVYIILSSVDLELLVEKSWKWLLAFNLGFNLLVRTLFAWQCARLQKKGISRPSSVFQMAAHTGLTAGLIAVVSHDLGMALVYLFLFLVLTWTSGVKLRWFALGAVVCVVGIILVWPHISDQYFARRVTVVIDHITGNQATLYEQTQGAGWQQSRSVLAIGSGGLTGQGYLQGIQTQSPYESSLPSRSADEIFAVCGEEFGLVGCILVILILAAIIARCVWVARRAPSPMTALAAMGYAGMLFFQCVLNIGMCLYVLPIVGLTLPFFSYGGTSIITMFAAMGAVSSIKTRSLPSWLRDRSQL